MGFHDKLLEQTVLVLDTFNSPRMCDACLADAGESLCHDTELTHTEIVQFLPGRGGIVCVALMARGCSGKTIRRVPVKGILAPAHCDGRLNKVMRITAMVICHIVVRLCSSVMMVQQPW